MNRTGSPDDKSSNSPVGAEGAAEDAGVPTAAPPPAEQPITASGVIQAAHVRLAQLLHASAAILEEITLGAAGGAELPTADVPAITNPEGLYFPTEGSRGSTGSGSYVHAGNSGGQSRHTASSECDAASTSRSNNATSSRL
ncbi:unnamed protein product [Lampetra planeri]